MDGNNARLISLAGLLTMAVIIGIAAHLGSWIAEWWASRAQGAPAREATAGRGSHREHAGDERGPLATPVRGRRHLV